MNKPLKYHEIPIPVANTSRPYRYYISEHYYDVPCPECGGLLGQQYSVGMVYVESENFESDNFIVMDKYSYFCYKCPVVVIADKVLKQVLKDGINGEKKKRYSFVGLVDFNALPEDQRDIDLLGKDGTWPPVVKFLPSLKK
jgi:hypothetical protein